MFAIVIKQEWDHFRVLSCYSYTFCKDTQERSQCGLDLEGSILSSVSNCGKEIRLGNIFGEDERAFVVAYDHGLMLGPVKGVVDFESILKKVIEGRPDALLLSPGQLSRVSRLFWGRGKPSIIVRADWTSAGRYMSGTLKTLQRRMLLSAYDALKLGASAAVIYSIMGYEDENQEADDFASLARFARECYDVGIPLIVEPIPLGPKVMGSNFADMLALAVRMAVEAGADVIKCPFTGNKESFSKVVGVAGGARVLVLGGEKMPDRTALQMVSDAIESGASGVVFGRNVIQSANPLAMAKAVRAIVHEGSNVSEAMRLLGNGD
jgi:class I fructose-bisphosphate aldolase